MDLNKFGTDLLTQLTRIADALESRPVEAATATKSAAKDEAPAKTTRSRAKPAAKKDEPVKSKYSRDEMNAALIALKDEPVKSKYSRDEMNAALIALKDECGKEFAQEVIRNAGYTKMAEIEDKDIDAVYEAAKAKHEEMANDNFDDEEDM